MAAAADFTTFHAYFDNLLPFIPSIYYNKDIKNMVLSCVYRTVFFAIGNFREACANSAGFIFHKITYMGYSGSGEKQQAAAIVKEMVKDIKMF